MDTNTQHHTVQRRSLWQLFSAVTLSHHSYVTPTEKQTKISSVGGIRGRFLPVNATMSLHHSVTLFVQAAGPQIGNGVNYPLVNDRDWSLKVFSITSSRWGVCGMSCYKT